MITNEKFKTMNFATHGFIEPIYDNASYRLPSNHKLNAYPCSELRSLISNVIHNVSKTTKTSIEELITLNCNISYSTYKQYMSGKNRKPSRAFISKICVGLKLSIEVSNELLRAHSGELNLTNDCDAITYYAIIGNDSVLDYEDELKEKIGIDCLN